MSDDYFNVGCDIIKTVIIVIVGFIIFRGFFFIIGFSIDSTKIGIARQCNLCIQEPILTILTLLILGIFGLFFIIFSLENKKKQPTSSEPSEKIKDKQIKFWGRTYNHKDIDLNQRKGESK